eukprot:2630736-Prymnesium_polylepis.3
MAADLASEADDQRSLARKLHKKGIELEVLKVRHAAALKVQETEHTAALKVQETEHAAALKALEQQFTIDVLKKEAVRPAPAALLEELAAANREVQRLTARLAVAEGEARALAAAAADKDH